MFMLFYKHLIELYRSYSKSLRYFGSSPVNQVIVHIFLDELINYVVLPHLCHVETDNDVTVRKFAAEILLSLAQTCNPSS